MMFSLAIVFLLVSARADVNASNTTSACASASLPVAASGNLSALLRYASETWNCDGASPPCPGCKKVPSGTAQTPYSCADWVAHVLVAGGYIPDARLRACGDFSSYSDVSGYDLNVVSSNPRNLFSYLESLGWTSASTAHIRAGHVCAVDAGDGPSSHAVLGTGDNLCAYHNIARWDKPCQSSFVSIQLCLKPPA